VTALGIITVVVIGTMVGVELAVAAFVNPLLDRLPTDSSLAARADGGRVLGRLMPFWYVASLALVMGWGVLAWGEPSSAPALVAAALLAVSVAMSVLLLVPINSRAMTWTPETAPADWREQTQRWDRLHYVRVAVILGAFALVALALARVAS
jgi:uncharacterized membrane protein